MRKTKTRPDYRGLKETLLLLVIWVGLAVTPGWAVLSDNTGQIQGRAPTGTVTLQALLPDGATLVTDNATLGQALIPNQFSVSPAITNPVLQDADGDSGLSEQLDFPGATLTWTHNGTALTAAQLAAPLGNNFSGETLALTVSAPLTISSVTGLPTTAGAQIYTTEYALVVDTVPPTNPLEITLDKNTAYVEGGVINMTVTARDSGGNPVSGAFISFVASATVDRQGNTGGWTGTSGPLLLDNTNLGGLFVTGPDGTVTIAVTQPGGLGVKTTITATSGTTTASTDVIFAIVTSPDTPLANMYGHMSETVIANSRTYKRPILQTEWPGGSAITINNESWGRYEYTFAATQLCGGIVYVPTLIQLISLQATTPLGQFETVHGWPSGNASLGEGFYWSNTQVAALQLLYVLHLNTAQERELSPAIPSLITCLQN